MRVSVLFDLSIVPHAIGGVSRYLLSLAGALEEVAQEEGIEFNVLDVPAVHPGVPGPPVGCIELKTPFYLKIPFLRRIPIRRKWELLSRSRRIKQIAENCSIFHHSGVQPEYPANSRSVVTIYDLSALEHPEWHTGETVAFMEREAQMIRNGSRVVAISEWTAKQASVFFNIDPESICVAGGTADDVFTPGEPSVDTLRKLDLKTGEYLLHVGHLVPRKNIPFLVDIYYRARERGLRFPLVMVGSSAWGNISIEHDSNVRIIENIDDGILLDLYRGAGALLCPSMYEGLGLPAMEALACNTPVIAANATALTETVGNRGMLLNPDDPEEWIQALLMLKDPGKMGELRSMAVASPRETWRDVARRLCGFYRKIAEE
ncbi:MAG: glycosyltransferase family 4 protein [Candidatus Aegiribacteria sp.]|nr:glycosyltransferase family 4 protein [Candidatus Aegiribacteria sp.]